MGAIIFWAIIRTAILIILLWIFSDWFEYKYWWAVLSLTVYGFIIHPAVIQYQIFLRKNREVLTDTLCSSCKHFDETAVLCLKYDEHPTKYEIPCGGGEWEPK